MASAKTVAEFATLLAAVDSELAGVEAPAPEPQMVAACDSLIAGVCADMSAALPPVAEKPRSMLDAYEPEPVKPVPVECAATAAMFDRSLAKSSLAKLKHRAYLDASTDGGDELLRIIIDERTHAGYQDAMLSDTPLVGATPGVITDGWYTTLPCGALGAIAIVHGVEGHGPFVDAFLIIPDGAHPSAPNPSLPPKFRLDEDFVFEYPDGTTKTIRLVPAH